jgi:hypothetical protein
MLPVRPLRLMHNTALPCGTFTRKIHAFKTN